jgi:membrane dipeptidase
LDYVFDQAELEEAVRSSPALFPPGLRGADDLRLVPPEAIADIAEGLARDNLTDAQIRGVLGENWLRIATRVWR